MTPQDAVPHASGPHTAGLHTTAPQDTVERALAAARSDDCIVIADESSTANLRWAGNTLTTNGVSRSRQLTVIAVSRRAGGTSVGVVSRAGVRDDQVEDVVRAAEQAAADGSAVEDAEPLLGPGDDAVKNISGAGHWDDPVASTEIGVFTGFAAELGGAFEAAQGSARKLYGYAEHSLTGSFLGTSTGLRLRHDQPTGKVEMNAKSADLARSAWAGCGTKDFTDVDIAALDSGLRQRLDWAQRKIDLPPGRYETLLPPGALADLLVYMYWSAGAKDALDGRSVFSKPGGGTRVGERLASLPLRLYSDPALPGLESSAFVVAHAATPRSSTTGSGLGPPTGSTTANWPPSSRPGIPRSSPGCRSLPASTTSLCRARLVRRRPWMRWWPAPGGASCSPASGTSARWTRRPCC